MLNIFQNKIIIDNIKNNSVIISSQNNLLKLKEIFINDNILITTFDNYIKKIVNKKVIDNTKSFIYMYKAFNNVKKELTKYKDEDDISFINILLNTYNIVLIYFYINTIHHYIRICKAIFYELYFIYSKIKVKYLMVLDFTYKKAQSSFDN